MNDESPTPLSLPKRSRFYVVRIVLLLLFVLGGFLLAYLLRDVDWLIIRQSGPATLGSVLGLTILNTLTYVLLVYILVRSSGYTTTLWKTYLVLTASLSVNYVTPIKVGFPLRVYLYNRLMNIPIAVGTALIAVEILVGILIPGCVAIVGIVILFPALGFAPTLILMLLLLAGSLFFLWMPFERIQPHLERFPFARLTMRLIHFAGSFQSGWRRLSPVVFLGILALDLLMVGIQTLTLWIVLSIFAPAPSLLAVLIVFTVSVTAGNLSMIPMGLGVRDISFTWLLVQLGVPKEIAFSVAMIQRLFSPGLPLLLGLISTNILGIDEILWTPEAGSSIGESS